MKGILIPLRSAALASLVSLGISACGGSDDVTYTIITPQPSVTVAPTQTPSPSPAPATPTPTATPAETAVPTATPTTTPTASVDPTATPSPTPTQSPSPTPTGTPNNGPVVFGVYTEKTTDFGLTFGSNAAVNVWNDMNAVANAVAYEGAQVLAWRRSPTGPGNKEWFGAGIASVPTAKDMSAYAGGNLKFRINIPTDVSFRIGVTTSGSKESWFEFPAGQERYGMQRSTQQWELVTIPLNDVEAAASGAELDSIVNFFAISQLDGQLPTTAFTVLIDDIVWESAGGVVITPTPTPTPTPSFAPMPLPDPNNPNLLWEDDFDSLDSEFWTPDVGTGCAYGTCGWGNGEWQTYLAANVSIDNGSLALEAKREDVGPLFDGDWSMAFSSGKVTSSGKVSVKYGIIEARVQVPEVDLGLWPAFWMLGTNGLQWPRNGEIDIMEMGQNPTLQYAPSPINNYVASNVIWYEPTCNCPASLAWDPNVNQSFVASSSLANRFVTYRLYWSPEHIRFTIDEENGQGEKQISVTFPSAAIPAFNEPMYILINLAVGGNFPFSNEDGTGPGQWGAGANGEHIPLLTAPLPAKMLIDYVRVSKYLHNGVAHGEVYAQ